MHPGVMLQQTTASLHLHFVGAASYAIFITLMEPRASGQRAGNTLMASIESCLQVFLVEGQTSPTEVNELGLDRQHRLKDLNVVPGSRKYTVL